MPDDAFQATRRAYHEAIRLGRADLAATAGRAFARVIGQMNALPAAFAMVAADSTALCAAAARPPGPGMDQVEAWLWAAESATDWIAAAMSTLELNLLAERLADVDCVTLAGRRLAACRRTAAELPAEFREQDEVAAPLRAIEEAYGQIEVSILRHEATRADAAGRPAEGRRKREAALAKVPKGTYLETVLTIGLGRTTDAARQLDRLTFDDAEALAYLNQLAGRPRQARAILDGRPAGFDPSWISLARAATIALDLDEHAEAERLAGHAIAAFEALPASVMHDYYRTLATDHVSVAEMYHVAVRARRARGDEEGAFALADVCRAGMTRTQPRTGSARDVHAWRAASVRLAATHERLQAKAEPEATPDHAAVVAQVMAAEDAVDRAAARLVVAPAGRPEPRPGLAEAQRALPENAALLMYQSFDRDLIVWAVRPDKVISAARTCQSRDLTRAVRELHAACADFAGQESRATTLAAELATDLIEPVAAALDGVERLYVVPPAHLMLLPFAVLPWHGVPLGEQVALSVLPAAALINRPGAELRFGPDRPMLLVGDPAYADLPRLPGTGAEVRGIASIRPAAVPLTDEGATAVAFAQHRTGVAGVHLATHGLVNERRPHLSALALAGTDRLTLPDLVALDLDLDLLVLSACHTGRGRATAGGDVFGLVRAAIAAGVRHLVVSLWPVHDLSGCRLMTAMHRSLVAGDDVATALRSAADEVRGVAAGHWTTAYRDSADAGTTGRIRDLGEAGIAEAADTNGIAHWAPFIHIGA